MTIPEIEALFADTVEGHPEIARWGSFDRGIVADLIDEIKRLRQFEVREQERALTNEKYQ